MSDSFLEGTPKTGERKGKGEYMMIVFVCAYVAIYGTVLLLKFLVVVSDRQLKDVRHPTHSLPALPRPLGSIKVCSKDRCCWNGSHILTIFFSSCIGIYLFVCILQCTVDVAIVSSALIRPCLKGIGIGMATETSGRRPGVACHHQCRGFRMWWMFQTRTSNKAILCWQVVPVLRYR